MGHEVLIKMLPENVNVSHSHVFWIKISEWEVLGQHFFQSHLENCGIIAQYRGQKNGLYVVR